MSCETWDVQGFGFEVDGADPKKTADFMEKHISVLKEMYPKASGLLSDIDKFRDEDEIACFSDADWEWETMEHNNDRLCQTLAEMLNRMYKVTGFEGNTGCEDVGDNILWARMYPWEETENDKKMTRKDVEGILTDFAKQTGIREEPDEQDYKYWG